MTVCIVWPWASSKLFKHFFVAPREHITQKRSHVHKHNCKKSPPPHTHTPLLQLNTGSVSKLAYGSPTDTVKDLNRSQLHEHRGTLSQAHFGVLPSACLILSPLPPRRRIMRSSPVPGNEPNLDRSSLPLPCHVSGRRSRHSPAPL